MMPRADIFFVFKLFSWTHGLTKASWLSIFAESKCLRCYTDHITYRVSIGLKNMGLAQYTRYI